MSFPHISPMTQAHLAQAVQLSGAEHWPHRLEDWQMLFDLSEGFIAQHDSAVVGTAMRTNYGPDVAMLNMIIVGQTERGKGLGRRLMTAVMDAADGREMRLLATKVGLPLYEKLGFLAEGEIIQCQGLFEDADPPSTTVRTAGPDDLAAIVELDEQYTKADRARLLHRLAQHARMAVTWADDGSITGYAALRRFGRGHVIGPIQAPVAALAQDLIRFFAVDVKGEFVRIDTDRGNDLAPWLERIGLKPVGGGVKMRKNAKTKPRPAFGLCSQALG